MESYRKHAEACFIGHACPATISKQQAVVPYSEDHYFLVDGAVTDRVLPVPTVSRQFRPVQPLQVMEALVPWLPPLTKVVDNWGTATSRFIFGHHERPVVPGDVVEQAFVVTLGPIGSVTVGQLGWRLVCRNGMMRTVQHHTTKVVHRGDIDKQLELLVAKVRGLSALAEAEFQQWQRLAETPLTQDIWQEMLDSTFPLVPIPPLTGNREQDEAKMADVEKANASNHVRREAAFWTLQDEAAALGCGQSVWLAMNAITKTLQHPPKGCGSPTTKQETRLHFGSVGQRSARVEQLALAYL